MQFDEIAIPTQRGDVLPALLHIPPGAAWLYVLAHGAGAGMRHRFMTAIAGRLAERNVASLRYEYPYMAAGKGRPDAAAVLEAATRDVAAYAARQHPALRLAAGGKSMGGRITSQAQAIAPLPRVERLIFLGFPLHAAGKQPNTARAEHLNDVRVPMLFLQGTRDALADITLMRQVCAGLGERATLHAVEGADHSFGVLRRGGRTDGEVLAELIDTAVTWLDR